MRIDYFGKSDKGKVRKGNEDYFACERLSNEEYLFVVADGMGGHRAGDVASKLGTTTFVKSYKKFRRKKKPITEAMNESLNRANLSILNKATADSRKRGMGTTFSAVAINGMKAYLVHVGDSRIYMIRNNEMHQLTRDHTFVGKMVEEGRITEDEARSHPQKNILYMSLGARDAFQPEINEFFELQERDIFVMCSDGLNNMVTDSTIQEYCQSFHAGEAVEELINLANSNGGTDNITVLVIKINPAGNPDDTEPIPVYREPQKPLGFWKRLFKRNLPDNDEE